MINGSHLSKPQRNQSCPGTLIEFPLGSLVEMAGKG